MVYIISGISVNAIKFPSCIVISLHKVQNHTNTIIIICSWNSMIPQYAKKIFQCIYFKRIILTTRTRKIYWNPLVGKNKHASTTRWCLLGICGALVFAWIATFTWPSKKSRFTKSTWPTLVLTSKFAKWIILTSTMVRGTWFYTPAI
jgi:hypothetical protein